MNSCKAGQELTQTVFAPFKGRSHYSDNQSPTSNNHYFWGGCRRLSEVGKCLSMIGDWLSENYIDNLSPTSDNHPFSGWFSMVGKWLVMIAEQFWSARGFRCSINNHRQPNKAAIQNEYTFDPEKCRWWRNRGRVVLSWSATGRRLVVGADLHNQLYHPHFKRNSNMYSWNCPRMVVKFLLKAGWFKRLCKSRHAKQSATNRRLLSKWLLIKFQNVKYVR